MVLPKEVIEKAVACLEDVKWIADAYLKYKEVERLFYEVLTRKRIAECTEGVKDETHVVAPETAKIVMFYPLQIGRLVELFRVVPPPHTRLFYAIVGGRRLYVEYGTDRKFELPSVETLLTIEPYRTVRLCFEYVTIKSVPKPKFKVESIGTTKVYTSIAEKIIEETVREWALRVEYKSEPEEEEKKVVVCRFCLEPHETAILIDGLYKFRELCRLVMRLNVPARLRSIAECLRLVATGRM